MTTAVSESTAVSWVDDWPNPLDNNQPVLSYSPRNAILNNPTIDKADLVDYDYLNVYELALAGVSGAMVMQNFLGNPTPIQVKQAFVDASEDQAGIYWVEISDDREVKSSDPATLDVGVAAIPVLSAGGMILLAAGLAVLWIRSVRSVHNR